MTSHGSCLCGAVRYEIDTPVLDFVYCHCSRCRKVTGTGHAANIVVAAGAFRWLDGEELVQRYDLPTAARGFASAFCKTCGSQMPHLTRSKMRVIVPSGSLDGPVDASPRMHAHWASRANWYKDARDLPKADEDTF
jgi:hypothetical protein